MKPPRTAFILGCGPTLPVGELHRLAREFTVGVNAIVRSGFTPAVVFFADRLRLHAPDVLEEIKATEAIRVGVHQGDRQHCDFHLELGPPTTAHRVEVRGNSGVGAARWCLALGVDRVVLVGMGGSFVDGRANFYPGPPGAAPRAELYTRELARLFGEYRGHVEHRDDPEAWDLSGEWSRDRVGNFLREATARH